MLFSEKKWLPEAAARKWGVDLIPDINEELNSVLPPDLPCREIVIRQSARHLALILEANRCFNLTRITAAREAAIKHVLDSVLPWKLFAGAASVLDAGSGAGFPGIPLALALPHVHFTLAESIGKKARFLEYAVAELSLSNATVRAQRAEEIPRSGERSGGMDVITARALGPVSRVTGLFAPALRRGLRVLLYKGPDVPQEIAEAVPELRKIHACAQILMQYDLPDSMGARTIVQIAAESSK